MQVMDSTGAGEGGTLHDLLVRASCRGYQTEGREVIAHWKVPDAADTIDLFLPGLGRIEEIETEESFEAISDSRLSFLQELPQEIWFVVPLARMSEAHQRLRGTADVLQPWWVHDHLIRFGQPRNL